MTKRGSQGQETGVAKRTELYRGLRLGKRKQNPAPGRKRFREGGWVKSTGRDHRY